MIWKHPEGDVKLTQDTKYPEEETSTLTISMQRRTEFTLNFRVPEWAHEMSAKINDVAAGIKCKPGTWASMNRIWNPGDRVEIRIPLRLRMQAIDRVHTDVVAIVRGPVAMVLESDYHEPLFRLPDNDEDLNRWIIPDSVPGVFRVELPGGARVRSKVRPFYDIVESYNYKMYFDRKALPSPL